MKPETAIASQVEILLVEDNPTDAQLVQDALGRSPHPVRVTMAPTAGAALDFLRKEDLHRALFPFDFILLDLSLPDMSGWEFLTTLKEDPLSKDIPVLILTGSQDQHDLMKAQFSLAQDYLQKPSDLAQWGTLMGYLEENWFKVGVRPK